MKQALGGEHGDQVHLAVDFVQGWMCIPTPFVPFAPFFAAPAGATKDMGKMLGGEEEKDPDAQKKEEERQEALRQQEEERKAKHARMEAEREKVRQQIRDKVSPLLPLSPKGWVVRLQGLLCGQEVRGSIPRRGF